MFLCVCVCVSVCMYRFQVCPKSGHRLADIFLTLPDRSSLPDYYEVIKKPVSLSMLQEKLLSYGYARLDTFQSELFQMFRNARFYNEPGSQVHVRAERVIGLESE